LKCLKISSKEVEILKNEQLSALNQKFYFEILEKNNFDYFLDYFKILKEILNDNIKTKADIITELKFPTP